MSEPDDVDASQGPAHDELLFIVIHQTYVHRSPPPIFSLERGNAIQGDGGFVHPEIERARTRGCARAYRRVGAGAKDGRGGQGEEV